MPTSEDPNEERGRGGSSEACEAARGQLPAFLAGDLPRSDQRHLRAHLSACLPCRSRFEESLGFAARLHANARRANANAARDDRRRTQRARALAGALRIPGGERGTRLRLILLPALAIFLFTQIAQGPRAAEAGRVELLEGLVQVGDQEVLAPGNPVPIRAGELWATGELGQARLSLGESTIELAPGSWGWLESIDAARLRLGGGRIRVQGHVTLTSRLGVVEVTGEARVRLDASVLEVEALRGDVLVADSRGERLVPSGRACLLRSP